jgi:general secretion pathway protein N
MERSEMRRAFWLLMALLALPSARAEPRNPLEALRLEDLTATRERPLFRPSRRPPAPPPVVAPAPEPTVEPRPVVQEPPPFELVGAVVGKATAIALLRDKTTNEIVRLRTGEEAEGWRVGTIGARSVALERDGQARSLALSAPSSSPTGPQIAGEAEPAEAVVVRPTGESPRRRER